METSSLCIRIDKITSTSDDVVCRSFSGTVYNSLDEWNDKYVIGLTNPDVKFVDENILEDQPIYQVSILSSSLLNNFDVQKIVNNFLSLSSALLCMLDVLYFRNSSGDYLFIRSTENDVAVIISKDWESSLSLVQWLLLKNVQIVVYTPETDDETTSINRWTRHPLFKHPSFKTKLDRVALKFINIKHLSDDVLLKTSSHGASSIVVLPGAVEAFGVDQVTVHREVLLAAGICCRIVWHEILEQVDPCECICLFDKGISLNFFNFNAIIKTQTYVGVLQHSIIETLDNIINSNLFLQ